MATQTHSRVNVNAAEWSAENEELQIEAAMQKLVFVWEHHVSQEQQEQSLDVN